MQLLRIFLLAITARALACSDAAQAAGYDLAHPTRRYPLADELREISGITEVDAHPVACVQDEVGALYFIDLDSRAVTNRLAFGKPGDYEGLTRVGTLYFALRSDGTVREDRNDKLRFRPHVREVELC